MYTEELESIIRYLGSYPAVEKVSINTKTNKIGLKILNNDGDYEKIYYNYDPGDLFLTSQKIMIELEDRYDE